MNTLGAEWIGVSLSPNNDNSCKPISGFLQMAGWDPLVSAGSLSLYFFLSVSLYHTHTDTHTHIHTLTGIGETVNSG